MSDTTTITTIARAIAKARGFDPDEQLDADTPRWAFARWESYEGDAQAALAALREQEGWKSPTEIAQAVEALETANWRSALDGAAELVRRDAVLRVLVGDEQAEETP